MKRLPTTLDKLKVVADKLEQHAALLRKQRERLARQQQRLERTAHDEALRQAGRVVESLGIPLDDLGTLEALLKVGLETDPRGKNGDVSVERSTPHRHAENLTMSTTPNVPFAEGQTQE